MLLAAMGIAAAGPITVANFSFENPVTTGISSPIPGWTGSGGVWRPVLGVGVLSVPDGSQVAYILGAGSMEQNLGVLTQAGVVYQLNVWVGTQISIAGRLLVHLPQQ